jgi:hypothetical protein
METEKYDNESERVEKRREEKGHNYPELRP